MDRRDPRGPTRRDPRWLLWVAGILLAARGGAGAWNAWHARVESELVLWVPLERAELEARKAHKPVLYDFTAAWCPPCNRLKQEVFGSADGAAFVNASFIPARVLDRNREEGRNPPAIDELQRRFHIEAFPTLVIVGPDGKVLDVQQGYGGAAATRQFLEGALKKGGAAKRT